MQPLNTSACIDASAAQSALMPEKENGIASGIFTAGLGHMVAGPYLSELMAPPARGNADNRPKPPNRESDPCGTKRAGPCGAGGLGDDRFFPAPTPMAESPRAISRSEPMRRGPDRCIVLLTEHERPSAALLASLARRGVEVLISFDHFDALARACLVQREAHSWDERGLLPKAGGLAMIISQPGGSGGAQALVAIKALHQAICSHAPRCVCWEFDRDAPPQTAALRPLDPLHNGATTAKLAPHVHALPMRLTPSHAEVRTSVPQGVGIKTRESAGLTNAEIQSPAPIAIPQPDGRMSNWETWASDNRPRAEQDMRNSPVTSENHLLSARELAMLLVEDAANSVPKAEFRSNGGVRNIAAGETSPEQGPMRA